MGAMFDHITDQIADFIADQPVFFVATAPNVGGRVNCSPKGYESFRVLGPHRVLFLDLTGSGAETIAHVRENGRITFMFCSFDAKPNISRVYGSGRVVLTTDDDFAGLASHFPATPGTRCIIDVAVTAATNSCGYGVPLLGFEGHRSTLIDWARRRGEAGVSDYWNERNLTSIDGLPALPER